MEVFDKTVESLTNSGVMVILNNHISDAKWCCSLTDGNGLWYNPRYSIYEFLTTLVDLTLRYKSNPMVIGNDLRNEIRDDVNHLEIPNWGKRDLNDWHLAATTAGNLILSVNPDQLIIVEGMNYANNMSPIKDKPIELKLPNKLVYSFHSYNW